MDPVVAAIYNTGSLPFFLNRYTHRKLHKRLVPRHRLRHAEELPRVRILGREINGKGGEMDVAARICAQVTSGE